MGRMHLALQPHGIESMCAHTDWHAGAQQMSCGARAICLIPLSRSLSEPEALCVSYRPLASMLLLTSVFLSPPRPPYPVLGQACCFFQDTICSPHHHITSSLVTKPSLQPLINFLWKFCYSGAGDKSQVSHLTYHLILVL